MFYMTLLDLTFQDKFGLNVFKVLQDTEVVEGGQIFPVDFFKYINFFNNTHIEHLADSAG